MIDNCAFAESFDLPFDLLCDTSRKVGIAYGACASAKARYARGISYLLDEFGTVQRVYGHVDPHRHAADVLRDIATLDG